MDKVEIWAEIEGYSRRYQISNLGNFKTFYRKETITDCSGRKSKYKIVGLYNGKKRIHLKIHRIVAEHFIPNPNNYECVNHINGNKNDNRAENLEWCSYSYNTQHAIRTGLIKNIGEGCRLHKLTKEQASFIKNDSKLSYTELSKIFKVTKQSIYYIKKGKSWKIA